MGSEKRKENKPVILRGGYWETKGLDQGAKAGSWGKELITNTQQPSIAEALPAPSKAAHAGGARGLKINFVLPLP